MLNAKIFLSTLIVSLLFLAVNSFAQWQYVGGFPYSAQYPPNISAVNTTTLWVAGGYNTPVVFRSTNGGANWTSMPTSGISADLFCVWGVDANTCWVGDGGAPGGAGGNAKVYKTTNAGVSWTTVLTTGGSLGFINGIVFLRSNPQIGLAESDPPGGAGQAYWWQFTTNGGTSWTLTNGGAQGSTFASAQNTVVLPGQCWWGVGSSNGNGYKVIWSTNCGTSFQSASLPLSGTQYFVYTFTMNTDLMHGAAGLSTSAPNIAITSNGCVSWTAHNMGAGITGNYCAKWVPGTDVIYVLGATGTNPGRKSTDAGNTWTTMTTASLNGFSNLDVLYNPATHTATAFGVAADGSCVRLVDTLVFPTGIHPIGGNTPTEYRLEQNYPNPFNPTTKINFALPKASNVTVKVYDMLGHEIKTLVNENKPAGIYSVDFDASSLSSGVYFYTINAGSFTASKKMTLVK